MSGGQDAQASRESHEVLTLLAIVISVPTAKEGSLESSTDVIQSFMQ